MENQKVESLGNWVFIQVFFLGLAVGSVSIGSIFNGTIIGDWFPYIFGFAMILGFLAMYIVKSRMVNTTFLKEVRLFGGSFLEYLSDIFLALGSVLAQIAKVLKG